MRYQHSLQLIIDKAQFVYDVYRFFSEVPYEVCTSTVLLVRTVNDDAVIDNNIQYFSTCTKNTVRSPGTVGAVPVGKRK